MLAIAALAGGCYVSPRLYRYHGKWFFSRPQQGHIWFFPAVDDANEQPRGFRVDRTVGSTAFLPPRTKAFWIAPVTIDTEPYGTDSGLTGPYGLVMSASAPGKTFGAISVENEPSSFLGFGDDCPSALRRYPVYQESFTVVEVESVLYKEELWQKRYCPSFSILGVVPYSRQPNTIRDATRVISTAEHPSLRIAAIEALVLAAGEPTSPDILDFMRRIADRDSSRRVRIFAKGYARAP